MEPSHAPKGSLASGPKHWWAKVGTFASSKVGLVALAPIIGILGALLTAELSHIATSRAGYQKERVHEAVSSGQLVDTTLAERTVSSLAVVDALERPQARPEIDALWRTYAAAVRAYRIQTWKNQLNIERDTTRKWQKQLSFESYINVVVTPAFDDLDLCVTQAHDAYVGQEQPAAAAAAAHVVLSACQAHAKLTALEHCGRDFTYEYDWSVLIQREVLAQDNSTWGWLGAKITHYRRSIFGEKAACDSDADCRQERFFGNIAKTLSDDCGPVPNKTKRPQRLLSSFVH